MKKVKLIYNSVAGQSRFRYFLDSIVEKFTDNSYDVSLFRASKKSKLEEYLLDSIDTDAIVIAGGDGTINKVINVMIKNNIDVPIGIIPAGTSNDFARHIKAPESCLRCVDKIIEGKIQNIDVGYVNGDYFINVCSAGLFTNASYKTDKNLKKMFGKLSYILTAIYQFFIFKPFEVRIETEKEVYIEKINLFLVFNGSSVGGIDKFVVDSNITDGLLDLIVIKSWKLSEVSSLIGKILMGTHPNDKNIIYLKEKHIKITRINGKCDIPDIDGDEGPDFPLDIKCIKAGLKMFI